MGRAGYPTQQMTGSEKMTIFKIIMLALAGAMIGHYMGKHAMDSLIDANIKATKRYALACVAILGFVIIMAVLDAPIRIGWVLSALLCALGFAFGFLFYILHNSAVGLKVKWNDQVGEVIPDLDYDTTRPETGYDLYLPKKKTEDNTYALVLYVHGGGFTGGSKKDGALWCKYMTAKGYVCASMDYTLQGKEQKSDLHLMSRQVLQCVEAVHKECIARSYPVTEMAVTGGSAGGTIALLFAYGLSKQSPVPLKFVFQQVGPVCFDPVWWGATNNDYKMQAMFISNFSGEDVSEEMVKKNEHLPIIAAMSPAALVREDTVPTLSAYGPRDKMVPAQLKYHLFEALEKYHVPYDYVEYPNSNHALYDDPKAQREFLKKLDEYCVRYFEHH